MDCSSKWEMNKLEIQTRDIHIPPTYHPPYLSNTPPNLCMGLFNFSLYFLFFILVLPYRIFITIQCHALIWQSIGQPSPHPRADLSSLMVLRTISQSHDEAQKSNGKQIHKLMEYTFWIFSFLRCKSVFHRLVNLFIVRFFCHIEKIDFHASIM